MDKNLIDLLVAISVVIISSLLVILVIVLLNKEADDNKNAIDTQRSMLNTGNSNNKEALITVLTMLENKQDDNVKEEIELLRMLVNSPVNCPTLTADVTDFTIPIVVLSFICIILFSSLIFFLYKAINLISIPSFSFNNPISMPGKSNKDDITTLTLTDSYESMF